jgi:hypothetical protein
VTRKTAAELDREIDEHLATRISIDMPMSEIRDRLYALGQRASELRDIKPHSMERRIGKNPTADQIAAYKELMRVWNRAYRRATKAYKEGVEISNQKFRMTSG